MLSFKQEEENILMEIRNLEKELSNLDIQLKDLKENN